MRGVRSLQALGHAADAGGGDRAAHPLRRPGVAGYAPLKAGGRGPRSHFGAVFVGACVHSRFRRRGIATSRHTSCQKSVVLTEEETYVIANTTFAQALKVSRSSLQYHRLVVFQDSRMLVTSRSPYGLLSLEIFSHGQKYSIRTTLFNVFVSL